jgi:hypothetical protein
MRDKTLATVVLIGTVLFVARSVFGDTTYYVDSIDGADSNLGTSPASAWRTIARVNSATLKPGDAILFRRGQEWREQLVLSSSGEEGRPITYASYGRLGGKPRINGADIYNGNHWGHEGGSVWSKPNHLPFDAEFAAGDTARNKFIVTIDGIRYVPVAGVDELREYTYTYDARTDRLFVFLADDPDGHVTESATRYQSIYVKSQRHIVLRDLEVMNSVSDNMYVVRGCKHILIEDVTSHHAGSRGLLITGEDLAVDPQGWAEHIRIEKCTFYNNGIRCDTAANDIGMSRNVRRVTIKKCVLHGDGENWGVDGILLAGSSNGAGHLIEGNLVFGHCENEIDFKGHFESPGNEGRTVIQHNILSESGGAVINIHYGSRHIDILYNQISLGQTYGVSLYNHGGSGAYDGQEGDVTMAYNVIRDNLRAGIRDGGRGKTVTAGGNQVYNNVIVKNGKSGDLAGISFQSFGWDIRNNIIWDNCGGDADRQLRPETPLSRASLTASHNLIGERPLFVNSEDNDFRLQAGSPAIDAGIHLGFDHDLDGKVVPSGKAPDVGAYEYGSSNPTNSR